MGPRVLRAVAVPWRTNGGGGIPLSARCRAKEDDVTRAMFVIVALVVVSAAHSVADEAPISGTVKAVDASVKTLTLQTTAQGHSQEQTTALAGEGRAIIGVDRCKRCGGWCSFWRSSRRSHTSSSPSLPST